MGCVMRERDGDPGAVACESAKASVGWRFSLIFGEMEEEGLMLELFAAGEVEEERAVLILFGASDSLPAGRNDRTTELWRRIS